MRFSIFEFRKMLIEFQDFSELLIITKIEQLLQLLASKQAIMPETLQTSQSPSNHEVQEVADYSSSSSDYEEESKSVTLHSQNEQPDLMIEVKELHIGQGSSFDSVSSPSITPGSPELLGPILGSIQKKQESIPSSKKGIFFNEDEIAPHVRVSKSTSSIYSSVSSNENKLRCNTMAFAVRPENELTIQGEDIKQRPPPRVTKSSEDIK